MEIKYIEPSVLHDEMLRLRKEKQMDFLECLSGMDWGIPDEKDAPDTPRGVFTHGIAYPVIAQIESAHIWMTDENDAVKVVDFALVEIRSFPDIADGRKFGMFPV